MKKVKRKKEYSRPVVRTDKVQLGVFGSYGSDSSGDTGTVTFNWFWKK